MRSYETCQEIFDRKILFQVDKSIILKLKKFLNSILITEKYVDKNYTEDNIC